MFLTNVPGRFCLHIYKTKHIRVLDWLSLFLVFVDIYCNNETGEAHKPTRPVFPSWWLARLCALARACARLCASPLQRACARQLYLYILIKIKQKAQKKMIVRKTECCYFSFFKTVKKVNMTWLIGPKFKNFQFFCILFLYKPNL